MHGRTIQEIALDMKCTEDALHTRTAKMKARLNVESLTAVLLLFMHTYLGEPYMLRVGERVHSALCKWTDAVDSNQRKKILRVYADSAFSGSSRSRAARSVGVKVDAYSKTLSRLHHLLGRWGVSSYIGQAACCLAAAYERAARDPRHRRIQSDVPFLFTDSRVQK